MRTKLLLLAVVSIIFATSFKIMADKSNAAVDQIQGVYVFIQSKPTSEYEYLGSVKKEYPQADGVIFTSVNMDQVDAVKFK